MQWDFMFCYWVGDWPAEIRGLARHASLLEIQALRTWLCSDEVLQCFIEAGRSRVMSSILIRMHDTHTFTRLEFS